MRINRQIRNFLLFALLAAGYPNSAETAEAVVGTDNFVPNSRFEEYYNGVLKNWVTFYGGLENFDVLPNTGGHGKNALRLNGETGKTFSISILDILLQQGLKYRLTAQMKSKDFANYNKGFVVVADAKWKWETKRLSPLLRNSGWQEYSVDFAPPETGLYKLIIYKDSAMTGKLYFDDIRLNRLYSSAGIKFDIAGINVVGNNILNGNLINYQREDAIFDFDAKITAPQDESEIAHQTGKIKLLSDQTDTPVELNYTTKFPGYYTLSCKLQKNGMLVDAIETQIQIFGKINVKLIKPAMRKLYKFPETKDLITEITFNESINEKCSLSLSIAVRGKSKTLLSETISLEKSQKTCFKSDISKLHFGSYDIRVILKSSSGAILSCVVQPLDVLNPENSVAFDADNNLIIDGKKVFPWGFTGNIVSYSELKRLKDSGFNVLLIYAPNSIDGMKEYLDKLHENGLKGIVYAAKYRKDLKMLLELVNKLKYHPALLAYDIADEPGGEKIGQFYDAYNLISDEDPHHPIVAIMANNNTYHEFKDTVDVFMVDPYPNSIPKVHQSLVYNFVSQAIDIAKKPVWDVPPAFERSPAWPVLFVAPTPEELKNDFYLALVAGAKGLIGYTYNNYRTGKKSNNVNDYLYYKEDPNRIYLPEKNPLMWQTCTNMSRDVEILKAFIFAADSHKRIKLSTLRKVFSLYKEWDGRCGGLIVNSEPDEVMTNVKLPDDFSGELRLPVTGKTINVKNGEFKITLKALEELYFEY